MINNIDNRIMCPACGSNINVLSRRCPNCTTMIDTVSEYTVVPGSLPAKVLSVICGLATGAMIGFAVGYFDGTSTTAVVSAIAGALLVDWRISRHGLGRKLITTIVDGQGMAGSAVKQRKLGD